MQTCAYYIYVHTYVQMQESFKVYVQQTTKLVQLASTSFRYGQRRKYRLPN